MSRLSWRSQQGDRPAWPMTAWLLSVLLVLAPGCEEHETAIILDFRFPQLRIPSPETAGDFDLLAVTIRVGESGREIPLSFDQEELELHDELTLALVRDDDGVSGVQVTAQVFGPFPSDEGVGPGSDDEDGQRRVSLGVVSEWVDFVPGEVIVHPIVFGTDRGCEDRDGDGHGAGPACLDEEGWAGWDCDDLDEAFHPGAPEACDGMDTDCDGHDAWFHEVDRGVRDAACDGWLHAGFCESIDVECIDGGWSCPVFRLPEEDNCFSFEDSNCNGLVECPCQRGDVLPEPCGDDPWVDCGTSVCDGEGFECTVPGYRLDPEIPCRGDPCGLGEWECRFVDGEGDDDQFTYVCANVEPQRETCNNVGDPHDEDCDGLSNGEDVESCPLGGSIGWQCRGANDTVGCVETETAEGRVWLCPAPLRAVLLLDGPFELSRDDVGRLVARTSCSNCYSELCASPDVQLVQADDGTWAAEVTVACDLGSVVDRTPWGSHVRSGVVSLDQTLRLSFGVMVRGTSAPQSGYYIPVTIEIPLPEARGGVEPWLIDPEGTTGAERYVDMECGFTPLVEAGG